MSTNTFAPRTSSASARKSFGGLALHSKITVIGAGVLVDGRHSIY
jgi:hypothetical protein